MVREVFSEEVDLKLGPEGMYNTESWSGPIECSYRREKELQNFPLLSPRKQLQALLCTWSFLLTLSGVKFESQLCLLKTLDVSLNLLENEILINKREKRQPVLTSSQDHYGNEIIEVEVLFKLWSAISVIIGL